MRLEDFWVNGGSDLLPTELECSACHRTVGEIEGGATLAEVFTMAEKHRHIAVIDGESATTPLALTGHGA